MCVNTAMPPASSVFNLLYLALFSLMVHTCTYFLQLQILDTLNAVFRQRGMKVFQVYAIHFQLNADFSDQSCQVQSYFDMWVIVNLHGSTVTSTVKKGQDYHLIKCNIVLVIVCIL